MVEGCGQLHSSLSWGDGFAADLDAAAAADGESSAAPFFDTLLDPVAPKPYRNNVILGPHVLPMPFKNQKKPNLLRVSPGISVKSNISLLESVLLRGSKADSCAVLQLYPASISSVSAVGTDLYDAWDSSWGRLQTWVRSDACACKLRGDQWHMCTRRVRGKLRPWAVLLGSQGCFVKKEGLRYSICTGVMFPKW